jgi:hypothetical protein
VCVIMIRFRRTMRGYNCTNDSFVSRAKRCRHWHFIRHNIKQAVEYDVLCVALRVQVAQIKWGIMESAMENQDSEGEIGSMVCWFEDHFENVRQFAPS